MERGFLIETNKKLTAYPPDLTKTITSIRNYSLNKL